MRRPRSNVIKAPLRGASVLVGLALVCAGPVGASQAGSTSVEQLAALLSSTTNVSDARYLVRRIVYARATTSASMVEAVLLGGSTPAD